MANILGVIAEFNPFHNGHSYFIEEAKKACNADYVIAVMSGSFTQRGLPAIINKWDRTELALQNEADMVIELPTLYSVSSAENFASGGIKILKKIGIINYIAFGAETNDIKTLTDISKILSDENEEYKLKLKEELGKGLSFPKARENAIIDYLKNNSNADKCNKKLENLTEENIKQVLSKSNNILAIEYLKAMERQHFNVTPIMIKRESDNGKTNLTSATEIRKGLSDKSYVEHNLANYVPKDVYNKIRENIANNTYYQDLEPLSKIIIYKIRMMKTEEIANVPDVSEGLENTIKNAAFETNSINNLISKVKSKRYTETRIQRILTCILLGITKDDKEMSKTIVPYVRVLGVKKDAKQLLSKIPNAVISIKEFEDNNANENLKRMLDFDKKSSDIYSIGYNGNHSLANLDYTKKLIVI